MKHLTLSLLGFLFVFFLSANNIEVNNVSLTGQNTTGGYTLVQFDLSWENSWRISDWDAAWIFV